MGMVFDIQKFCVNDGPGIRSVIFLKGCPLKCLWCHNPESNKRARQLSFDWTKCINCGKCIKVCGNGVHRIENQQHKVLFDRCKACEKCVRNCPAEALSIYGKETTAEEIVNEVLKDRDFYETSGGGVTISGGEPTYQPEFSLELAQKLKKEQIHVCMETSGCGTADDYQKIAPWIDCFLYDYKATGDESYKKLTGISEKVVLNHLNLLLTLNKQVILRCPVIPQYNLTDEHLRGIARISKLGVSSVEIIPYHDMGAGKAKKIGSEMFLPNVKTPKQNEVNSWIEKIISYGGINIKMA